MYPIVRHHRRVEGAARLRDFVLVVWKYKVNAATVNVELMGMRASEILTVWT